MSKSIPMRYNPSAPQLARTNSASRPEWLRVKAPGGHDYDELKQLVRQHNLHTVCESARCPNIGECWGKCRTATFLILGDICTRSCAFCAVNSGTPTECDFDEPYRVAEAIATLKLKYAVITSVTRDDLADGGSSIYAETIKLIKDKIPDCKVEVLIPDFQGNLSSLAVVVNAKPDVLNHNIETVSRLYPLVRPQADYCRSFKILKNAKDISTSIVTKSGIMLGLGENNDEVCDTLREMRNYDIDNVTIGQYLRPSTGHLPVMKYYSPDEFEYFAQVCKELGFKHIESAPLVRSSYHADNQKI
ncbi:MAG: lipoyl synthase [bacterium]